MRGMAWYIAVEEHAYQIGLWTHADIFWQTFTIDRDNDIVCKAIDNIADRIKGHVLSSLVSNWGQTWRYLVSDSQLRWIGPEKGVIHLALGAVVNAIWDLWAKTLNKPVWQVVAEMSPEEFVCCIDFRYITDAIAPEEAIELLKQDQAGEAKRVQDALNNKAVPAYKHFEHPAAIKDGFYQTPMEPGYSVEMKPNSMDHFEFPGKVGG